MGRSVGRQVKGAESCPHGKMDDLGFWSSSRVSSCPSWFSAFATPTAHVQVSPCHLPWKVPLSLRRQREVMRHPSASQKPRRLHPQHVHTSQASEERGTCQCHHIVTVLVSSATLLKWILPSGTFCMYSQMDGGPRNLFGNDT